MLERLHPAAHVVQRRPGAGAAELGFMAAQYPALPQDFLNLFNETADLQLFFKKGYLRLYAPAGGSMDADQSIPSVPIFGETVSGLIPVGENGGGDGIVVLPGRGIYRVSEDSRDYLEDLEAQDLVFVAPDLQTLLSDARALCEASAAAPRRSWRAIRRWRKLNLANAYSSRVFLRQAAVLSVASVVLATLHFGWRGLLLGVLGVIALHRVASREYGGGEGPFEVFLAVAWVAVLTIVLLSVAAVILGGLGWLYSQLLLHR